MTNQDMFRGSLGEIKIVQRLQHAAEKFVGVVRVDPPQVLVTIR